ncbi:ABC transporter ATP-binding protein [Ancylobacter dichloromethanicus]|uniref:ABC transporter ATP-binding protein n=1 Tax=Ancylobacter dichloromethanicus TaxID=518825 RepID=A0A9W6JAG1_9HYPH|nr:ABC transporter ATP-binding protein [Ancylobacter dichloromethanicus]GLK72259.1 ABC transporter ATP-binding protein [Ancylobacter dichloromethanicus]
MNDASNTGADAGMSFRNLIHLAGVGKSYGAVNVLKPIDLVIGDGEFLTILGPSGSGKTTILRMLGGFTPPSVGRILLDGVDITDMPIFERPFNTVFQDYALFPHMSVARNVGYGLKMRGRPRREIDRKVADVLAIVDLADKAQRYPAELSGGQRQRVALARAIVCEPRVVLLDEPLGALDAELRRSMQDFLKALQRRIRTTFVFITHDQEEAISMSDRIVVMDHGKVEQIGTPKDIYYRPQSEFVAKFFGENNVLPARLTGSGASPVAESPLGSHALLGPAPADAFSIAIRPESFSVGDAGTGTAGQRSMVGRLESLTFLGATTQLVVRLGEGSPHTVKVRLPTPDLGNGIGIGKPVPLRWSDADVSILVARGAP